MKLYFCSYAVAPKETWLGLVPTKIIRPTFVHSYEKPNDILRNFTGIMLFNESALKLDGVPNILAFVNVSSFHSG